MAIGRTFQESLQKALRGLETGKVGLDPTGLDLRSEDGLIELRRELKEPGPERLFYVADAFRAGMSAWRTCTSCRFIDPWFLDQIEELVADREARSPAKAWPRSTPERLRALKRKGFSDARLAQLAGTDEAAMRALRHALRRAAGLQARRLLRGRVRHHHRLPVLDLRGRMRGRADRPRQDHGARRRPQPHRPGHRVRLLLRARRAGAARGWLRDHHGQLQPGNRVDRLRHLRPPVLRAADARRRAGDRRDWKSRWA